jgi:hypothetical protein
MNWLTVRMADREEPRRDLVAESEAAYATTPPWDIGGPQLRDAG